MRFCQPRSLLASSASVPSGWERDWLAPARCRALGCGRSPKSTCSVQPTIGWMPASASLSENSSAPNRLLVSVSPSAGKPRAAASLASFGMVMAPSSSE